MNWLSENWTWILLLVLCGAALINYLRLNRSTS